MAKFDEFPPVLMKAPTPGVLGVVAAVIILLMVQNAGVGQESSPLQWNLLLPKPGYHINHAMTYDSVRGATVLFGGRGQSQLARDGTWEYDGQN
ncbi:MAG: hypothetical protein JNG88_06910 [Phycisphaerales bacterium]|nr:hypothetical protein [Phycisphaerales bacterium]